LRHDHPRIETGLESADCIGALQLQSSWQLIGGPADKFQHVLASINDQGLLLKQGRGLYKLQSSEFELTSSQRNFNSSQRR
jgi:hypothetical protein